MELLQAVDDRPQKRFPLLDAPHVVDRQHDDRFDPVLPHPLRRRQLGESARDVIRIAAVEIGEPVAVGPAGGRPRQEACQQPDCQEVARRELSHRSPPFRLRCGSGFASCAPLSRLAGRVSKGFARAGCRWHGRRAAGSALPRARRFCYLKPATEQFGETQMCDSRLGLALAVMFLAVLAGCSKPAASLPEDRVAAEERTAAPQPAAAAENPQSDAAEEPELAAADSAQLPPTAQVAFDDAEDSPAAVPAVQVALATEPADALFRRRMLDLLAEARAAATVLEAHGSTESFDRHCRRLKNLLEDARLADEDDQFEAISAPPSGAAAAAFGQAIACSARSAGRPAHAGRVQAAAGHHTRVQPRGARPAGRDRSPAARG